METSTHTRYCCKKKSSSMYIKMRKHTTMSTIISMSSGAGYFLWQNSRIIFCWNANHVEKLLKPNMTFYTCDTYCILYGICMKLHICVLVYILTTDRMSRPCVIPIQRMMEKSLISMLWCETN